LEFRQAAGFEGLIVLAVIYFILSQLQKAGKRVNQAPPHPLPPASRSQPSATQPEGLSLRTILREIERVKQEMQIERPDAVHRPLPAPRPGSKPLAARRPSPPKRPQVAQDERGPLGRHSQTRLPSAEEVEELTTFDEGRSLEDTESVEGFDADRSRRTRLRVDTDEQAEAVIQQRLKAVEARNQPHRDADHRAFDQKIRAEGSATSPKLQFTSDRLKEAFVWREILGPPKALED
jgi:hypothetical protein